MNYSFGVSSTFGKCQTFKSDYYSFESFNDGVKDYVFLSVSDGKGKIKDGIEVSNWAVTFLKNEIREMIEKNDFKVNELIKVYYKINLYIKEYASEVNSSIYTSLLTVIADGEYIHIINVGSSRAYLIYEDKISKLIEEKHFTTEDSELLDESAEKLGNCDIESIEYQFFKMSGSSCLLLCTDGVYKAVDNVKMHSLIKRSSNAQEYAEKLVDFAKRISGVDDMTVVLFYFGKENIFRSNKFYYLNNIIFALVTLLIVFGAFTIFNVEKHKQKKEEGIFDEKLLFKKNDTDKSFNKNIYQAKEEKANLNLNKFEISVNDKQVPREELQGKKWNAPLKVINGKDRGYIKFPKEEIVEKVESLMEDKVTDYSSKGIIEEKMISDEKSRRAEDGKEIGVLIVNTNENNCQVKVFEGYSLITINRSGEKINLPLGREYKIEVSKDEKLIGEQDFKLDTTFKVIDVGIK